MRAASRLTRGFVQVGPAATCVDGSQDARTVLDIAKIEPGRFTLNTAEYAIESVVETVRSDVDEAQKVLAVEADAGG
jgi:hypothetical protein